MNLSDSIQELFKELAQRGASHQQMEEALDTFLQSYEEHRREHGSLKHKTGQEYSDGMKARIGYCKKMVDEYFKNEG